MVQKKLNLYEPFLPKDVCKVVNKYIKKNEISTYGTAINLFENKISKITRSKFNLATISGSSALCVAIKSTGLKKNELVITQSYTFIATINSIVHAGGEPILLDISKDDLSLNLESVERFIKEKCVVKKKNIFLKKNSKRIAAICLVLSFAIVPNLKKLKNFQKLYNIKVILDAACALGSKYENQALTKFCDVAIYSFNGNKTLTTGGGGLIATDKKRIFNDSKLLITNGKSSRYEYSRIAYNYKMTNLNAAIGLTQIKSFNYILRRKRFISSIYKKKLQKLPINFLPISKFEKTNHWINFVELRDSKKAIDLIKYLNKHNINTFLFWKPMHLQKLDYKIEKYQLNYTNLIWNKIVPLPSHPNLSKKDIFFVINTIKKFFNEQNSSK
jgi:perosamine synthetase